MNEPPLEVLVNGEAQRVPGGCTVDELLEKMGLERRRIAVAINREVVPRSSFGAHSLATGDRVEILEAVGGGA
jgi:sulfur carrier protein